MQKPYTKAEKNTILNISMGGAVMCAICADPGMPLDGAGKLILVPMGLFLAAGLQLFGEVYLYERKEKRLAKEKAAAENPETETEKENDNA